MDFRPCFAARIEAAISVSTVPRIAQNDSADQQAAAEHAERRREIAFPERRNSDARSRRTHAIAVSARDRARIICLGWRAA